MAENVIGFSILITGTDSEVKKLGEVKRELIDLESKLKKLTESTKGNVGAQKASAVQMAALQAQIKALKSEYNQQEKAIITNAEATKHAAGSYNALVAENSMLSAQLRALPIDITNEKFLSLQRQLLANTEQLKQFDAGIDRHFRNVGNYPNQLSILGKGFHGLTGIVGALSHVLGVHSEALNTIVEVGHEAAKVSKEITHVQHLQHLAHKNTATAVGVEAVAHGTNEKAVVQETIVQKALNAVKALGTAGIGLLIAALTASAIAVYKMVSAHHAEEEAMKLRNTAVDGTIIANKELRDSYNEAIVSMNEINNAWAVHKGLMTEAEAAISNLAVKNSVALNTIKQETAAQLAEVDFFWTKLLLGSAAGQAKENEERLRIMKEGADKRKAVELAQAVEERKIKTEAQIKTEEELAKAKEEADKKAKEARKKAQEEFEQDLKQNAQRILELTIALTKGQVDLMADGIEKEKAAVANKYDELIKAEERGQITKLSNNKKLREQEIQINALSNQRILQLELQKQKDLLKIDETEGKKQIDLQLKQADLEEIIAVEGVRQSTDTEKEKAAQILELQKAFASEKIEILESSADAETLEVQAQIAKLKTIVASEKPKKGESYLEMLFGTNAEAAQLALEGAVALVRQIGDAVFEAQREQNQRALDANIERLNDAHEAELTLLENRLTQGSITETQFRNEKLALDNEFRAAEKEEKKKAFEEEKQLKIKQIEITTAISIAEIWLKSLSETAPIVPAGVALAAVATGVALAGAAIQIGAINAQTFERGGVLDGPSHDNGGIPFRVNGKSGFEAEGGEALINKRSTAMYKPLLSRINQAGGGRSFAMGGIPVPVPSSASILEQSSLDFNTFANKIVNGFNDKRVKLLESDVRGALNQADILESSSTF